MKVKKRLTIGFAAIILVLLGVYLFPRRDTKVYYQGRSIDSWVVQLSSADQKSRDDAAIAIKAMGTNAIPDLVRLLHARESMSRSQIWRLTFKLPQSWQRRTGRLVAPIDPIQLRGGAAQSLGSLGLEARLAIPELAKSLRDTSPQVCWQSAKALARMGKAGTSELVFALDDYSPVVRHAAGFALGDIGADAAAAVPSLTAHLDDLDASVRSAAIYALAKIGMPAIPSLAAVVDRENAKSREAAARLIAQYYRSMRLAVPPLAKMAQDKDPALRKQAIETLGEIRMPDASAAKAVIGGLKDPSPEVRLTAAKALDHMPWNIPGIAEALATSLNDESAPVRECSARTLGRLGIIAKPAVPALTVLSNDREESVRNAAREALAKINP